MPVPFQCPHCGKVTQVADEYVGQSGPCAACGQTVTIGAPQKPTAVKASARPAGMSTATVAIIAVLCVFVCGGVGVALLLPAFESAGEAAKRMQCSNNLKQIAIALHVYHDTYRAFPPAYTVDAEGNKLHSWRTLILPYMEHSSLHSQIDFNSPWDSPHNQQVFAQMPIPPYHCSSSGDPNLVHTNYMAIVGPAGVFTGADPISIGDIIDGTSNTIMVVEVAGSTTKWMEPVDLDLESMALVINGGAGEIGSNHPGGAQVALADGSVSFLAETINAGLLKAMITRNGGEVYPRP